MKRVNIHLDDDLDAELAAEAARRGESKASLLRRAARAFLDGERGEAGPGWASFTGAVEAGPDDRPDDEIIYG